MITDKQLEAVETLVFELSFFGELKGYAKEAVQETLEYVAQLETIIDAQAAEIEQLQSELQKAAAQFMAAATEVGYQAATIERMEVTNEDLTCRLAEAEAANVGLRQSIEIWEQTARANQLFQPWQPIDTETQITVNGDALLIVEEGGDQLMIETTNGFELFVALPDDVRLCRGGSDGAQGGAAY